MYQIKFEKKKTKMKKKNLPWNRTHELMHIPRAVPTTTKNQECTWQNETIFQSSHVMPKELWQFLG